MSDPTLESPEGREPATSYFLSGTDAAPVIYVEGPDRWRSYRPGRVVVNQAMGPIPPLFKGVLREITEPEALQLLDAQPFRMDVRRPRADAGPAPEPRGLGGWLVLPLVSLGATFLSQIITLGLRASGHAEWAGSSEPGQQRVILWAVLNGVYIVAPAALLLLAFLKKRAFPPVMIGYLVFGEVVRVADTLWVRLLGLDTAWSPGALGAFRWATTGFTLVAGICLTVIWIWYFLVSKRVKNTFTRPLRPLWRTTEGRGEETPGRG